MVGPEKRSKSLLIGSCPIALLFELPLAFTYDATFIEIVLKFFPKLGLPFSLHLIRLEGKGYKRI